MKRDLLLAADMLVVCAALLLAWSDLLLAMAQPIDETPDEVDRWLRKRQKVTP